MDRRRMVIGAIGGDDQDHHASEIGAAVAALGCILLTGGGNGNCEVKNAAAQGMKSNAQQGAVTRFIGILPSGVYRDDSNSDGRFWLLETGLTHYQRNLINGVTPDVLIVFGGGCGTLAEAAFAIAAGKRLYFYGEGKKGPALQRLRANLIMLAQPGNMKSYIADPLELWPGVLGEEQSSQRLFSSLSSVLASATQWHASAIDLVKQCISDQQSLWFSKETGFPGLPRFPGSKKNFEDAVIRISE